MKILNQQIIPAIFLDNITYQNITLHNRYVITTAFINQRYIIESSAEYNNT
jgi:hypothetical protein